MGDPDLSTMTDEERAAFLLRLRTKWEASHTMLTLKVKALTILLSSDTPIDAEQMPLLREAVENLGRDARQMSVLFAGAAHLIDEDIAKFYLAEIDMDNRP